MTDEFKPTTNVQIESNVVDLDDEQDPPPEPIKPHRQAATCCPIKEEPTAPELTADMPYNPLLLLQALGIAFAAGALIGVGVSYAFSRPSVYEYLSE